MNTIVVGAYWGDEGKGKIVDLLAADSDWVVRYNGGDNAGHTLVVGGKKMVLHTLPSGVLQGKNCAIGPDVFFNPGSFLKELKQLDEAGFTIKGRILIDERAHVVMPYHIKLDGGGKLGTTRRGIGPCAVDKANRVTDITVADMMSETFAARIVEVVEAKKAELLASKVVPSKFDLHRYCKRVHEVYASYAERIREHVGSVAFDLHAEMAKGKNVLIEGAQATLLDVVHGTRPYVTSSNTTSGGAAANLGIDLRGFTIVGIAKAYPTRVGEGPFPTELGSYAAVKKEDTQPLTFSERKKVVDGNGALLGKWIRQEGAEYGATTGRPRRVGSPDFVALRYAAMINGIDQWAITKLDVLGGKPFHAAVEYEKEGKRARNFPFLLDGWKGVFGKEYFWPVMSEKECVAAVSKGYDSLPSGMKNYIRDLVGATGVPVSMISLSPQREITVVKDVIKRTTEYLKR